MKVGFCFFIPVASAILIFWSCPLCMYSCPMKVQPYFFGFYPYLAVAKFHSCFVLVSMGQFKSGLFCVEREAYILVLV